MAAEEQLINYGYSIGREADQIQEEISTIDRDKAYNLFSDAMENSPLRLVGGPHDQEKISGELLIDYLHEIGNSEDTDRFYGTLPVVAQALLFSKGQENSKLDYVSGIGGYDYDAFVPVSVELARSSQEQPAIAFRVVYGASEQMSVRAVDYINPFLVAMQRLHDAHGRLPQLQVISADHIGIVANNLNPQKVAEQYAQFVLFTEAYIEECFPDIKDQVVFLQDTEMDEGSQLREDIDDILDQFPDYDQDMAETLLIKGKYHAESEENIQRYVAAHIIVHDTVALDVLQPHPAITQQEEAVNPQFAIISGGGKQEEFFYRMRHHLKLSLDRNYSSIRTAQIFTNHHVPPYYMARGGDIPLSAYRELLSRQVNQNEIAPTAQYDINHLVAIARQRARILQKRRGYVQ